MIFNQRHSGILCPIFSLQNNEGIGTLGASSFEFVDFLADTNQKYWQVLPIGPTSYGDSPYQSYSSYAGNPYFIDLETLKNEGLLSQDNLSIDWGNGHYVDYEKLWNEKYKLLRKAFQNYTLSTKEQENAYSKYFWLKDYTQFMALKNFHKGIARKEWTDGKTKYTLSDSLKNQLIEEERFQVFLQIKFYEQWFALKKYANDKGVLIIGDLPIFVAEDSADVWAYPQYFKLDDKGYQTVVAGVPPDYFSETGQLWGNPLYHWEEIQKDNFSWWIDRIESSLTIFDGLRIDHFRAFESYWEIPAGETTAINGQWQKAPGQEFFDLVKIKLNNVPIIAEDLGIITDEVRELMRHVGFPGMSVLQFAFDNDEHNPYKPHNIKENSIVYTGTHDNDTTVGWYLDPQNKDAAHNALQYMHKEYLPADIFCTEFIEIAFNCKANTVITPIQDILCLGGEAKINTPSTLGNNWHWRLQQLPNESQKTWLLNLTRSSTRI